MKQYVSSKSETVRIFENRILDVLSRVPWFLPFLIYVPIIIGFILLSLVVYKISTLAAAELFFAGLFVWTFAEYAIHRFLFHYRPKSRTGKKIIWLSHGIHHDYPSDPLRLFSPPIANIFLTTAIYGLFYLILGKTNVPVFMGGFLIGYLIYGSCHYAVHHLSLKNPFLIKIRAYHMRHHFDDSSHGFGVSSSLWDIVFRTEFRKKKDISSKVEDKKETKSEKPVLEKNIV